MHVNTRTPNKQRKPTIPLQTCNRSQDKIASLNSMSYKELKTYYYNLMGQMPPKRIGRKLLILAIAYEIQCKGNLQAVNKTRRNYAKIAATKEVSIVIQKPKRQMKPGGRLVREWHGKSYEVYIHTDSVIMDGKHYKSLSAVAKKITGVKWNGPRFFGLRSTRTERAS